MGDLKNEIKKELEELETMISKKEKEEAVQKQKDKLDRLLFKYLKDL